MTNTYFENGVILSPNVVGEGDRARVVYKGILKNCGADSVVMHYGFGDRWENKNDIRMNRTMDGFEAELPITAHKTLNMVFKDSANNWDNNDGRNYAFTVQSR